MLRRNRGTSPPKRREKSLRRRSNLFGSGASNRYSTPLRIVSPRRSGPLENPASPRRGFRFWGRSPAAAIAGGLRSAVSDLDRSWTSGRAIRHAWQGKSLINNGNVRFQKQSKKVLQGLRTFSVLARLIGTQPRYGLSPPDDPPFRKPRLPPAGFSLLGLQIAHRARRRQSPVEYRAKSRPWAAHAAGRLTTGHALYPRGGRRPQPDYVLKYCRRRPQTSGLASLSGTGSAGASRSGPGSSGACTSGMTAGGPDTGGSGTRGARAQRRGRRLDDSTTGSLARGGAGATSRPARGRAASHAPGSAARPVAGD